MDISDIQMLGLPLQEPCREVLLDKYALDDSETCAADIHRRVAKGLARDRDQERRFLEAFSAGFTPGGRINRAIGSGLETTAINCFVQGISDTTVGTINGVPGIMDALADSASTMRRGGGVGYDFSPIRPRGAWVKGTHSDASGPVSYMRVFDTMCETVISAGGRRGAQMGVLRIDHPDIVEFINAKKAPDFGAMGLPPSGVRTLNGLVEANPGFAWPFRKAFASLSNFNISVAVTDEFMKAKDDDADFDLVHEAKGFTELPTKLCSDGKIRYVYKTMRARELWAQLMRNTYETADPGIMFIDRVNRANNLRYVEVIHASNPCGEQFLPHGGCCDLGSTNLYRFVQNPFTDRAAINLTALKSTIATGVEILDRVLDVSPWPLQNQREEAMAKRRIGVGFYGLADAMAMMGIRYDSQDGVEFARHIAQIQCYATYEASIELAKKLGPFPLFDADRYLEEGTFASTLPAYLKDQIRTHGIRNSHLMSIAPTGTIAMGFGDNASSGIEPIFSKRQRRHIKIKGTDQRRTVHLDSASYRMYKHMFGEDADSDVFVEAQSMSVQAHLDVVAAVAPYVDSAISKTINVPVDYPFEDFERVYTEAHKLGLKGITTYRPNATTGTVLEAVDMTKNAEVKVAEASDFAASDADRRIELKSDAKVTQAMRFPSRPRFHQGSESMTYRVDHPDGEFALIIGHYQNGTTHPLEVYVAGNEQPRGLAAIAKLLSLDMRAEDPAWLHRKLDSLIKTQADDAFEMPDPGSGKSVAVPSLVSGMARLIKHRMTELGVADSASPSLMTDSLFALREPKTGPDGSIGWNVDVSNASTGDDFVLMTKEIRLEDGSIRPYSVWLSGTYPRVLDGMTKVLSIDMRVSDVSWVLMKLRKLTSFGEQRGDFRAIVPGSVKSKIYPSTVAYIAELLLHRYRMLGFVLGESTPEQASNTNVNHPAPGHEQGRMPRGKLCPECHTYSMHKRDGCEVCDHCGHTGSCG